MNILALDMATKTGRFPQPVKLGPRITAWRAADILEMIELGN